jgi:hypothetical protein
VITVAGPHSSRVVRDIFRGEGTGTRYCQLSKAGWFFRGRCHILETVSNIQIHISVKDLKAIAYFTLLPLFSKWLKEFSLSINDLQLRFKGWVELIPLEPK